MANKIGNIPTANDKLIAQDEREQEFVSLTTGEVLRKKDKCPLVIIRSRDAGVHIGYLARASANGGEVELLDDRRLWQWTGGRNTLNEIAALGIVGGRISDPVPHIIIFDACEIIPVLPEAATSLTTSRWD